MREKCKKNARKNPKREPNARKCFYITLCAGQKRKSVAFWLRFGCVLVAFWLRFGHVLVMFWSCFGRVLVAFWSRFGRVLVINLTKTQTQRIV